jgi:hypothetical protein
VLIAVDNPLAPHNKGAGSLVGDVQALPPAMRAASGPYIWPRGSSAACCLHVLWMGLGIATIALPRTASQPPAQQRWLLVASFVTSFLLPL